MSYDPIPDPFLPDLCHLLQISSVDTKLALLETNHRTHMFHRTFTHFHTLVGSSRETLLTFLIENCPIRHKVRRRKLL